MKKKIFYLETNHIYHHINLEKNKQKCLIVVDKNQKFYGTLTDGDVRRAILNNSNVHNTIKSYVKKGNRAG